MRSLRIRPLHGLFEFLRWCLWVAPLLWRAIAATESRCPAAAAPVGGSSLLASSVASRRVAAVGAVAVQAAAFCFMVESPFDKTAALARKQMEGCGEYAVFSNYSDPSTKTVQLFGGDELLLDEIYGWANNSWLFKKVWVHIAASDLTRRYAWFVKIDPDSFFRPRYLWPLLARHDPSKPMGIGREPVGPHEDHPKMQGSLEVVSWRALRHERTPQLLLGWEKGQEDTWLTDGLRRAGMDILVLGGGGGCNPLHLDYFNIPHDDDIPHRQWDTDAVPRALRALLADPDLECLRLPEVYGRAVRVHRHVVAAHPAKDVATYRELQALDLLELARER